MPRKDKRKLKMQISLSFLIVTSNNLTLKDVTIKDGNGGESQRIPNTQRTPTNHKFRNSTSQQASNRTTKTSKMHSQRKDLLERASRTLWSAGTLSCILKSFRRYFKSKVNPKEIQKIETKLVLSMFIKSKSGSQKGTTQVSMRVHCKMSQFFKNLRVIHQSG
jgi:hypothetical protein